MAKSEKRKAREEADAAKEAAEAERPVKRAKKEKKRKEEGVLEGVELPDERKVKRGWTEPPSKNKKEKKEKREKQDKDGARQQRDSKYTKEPELLFKAKLTPVAATEVAHKEKSKEKKKEKKEKNKSKAREVVVHEFEKNHKTPSFLKETKVSTEKKPAVDYVNGQGWVDEDGVVVEPETGRARARRALELVDAPSAAARAWIDGSAIPGSSPAKAIKTKSRKEKKATPPPSSSESEADDSSVVSSSSEDEVSSGSESEAESESEQEDDNLEVESAASSPTQPAETAKSPEKSQTPIPESKEVHPLEALFKRAKPTSDATTTPVKKLQPINTSFSFFESTAEDTTDVNGQPTEAAPTTPFTQVDLEWRGLRSAAPTPDTAAIGRRFSFDWRKNSQEIDDENDDDDDEDMTDVDPDAKQQLSHNTRANATKARLAEVAEEEEDEDAAAAAGATEDKPDSEFKKWFWENRGDLNRAWKKRRRDALKTKRHAENRKMTGGRRLG